MTTPKGVKMFNPAEGREANINPADVKLALEQGWVQGGAPAADEGGFGSLATNLAERGASGATLGLSDVLLSEIGGEEYRKGRAARDETWGDLGAVAEFGGAIAPVLLTGGAGGAAKLAALTPAGMAARVATRAAGPGGVLRMAAGGAVEGALQGAGQQLSEEALTNYYGGPDAVAERIWAAGRSGAIFGGIAGGAVGVAGRLAKKFSPTPDTLADWADSAAANSVMGSRAREVLGADGALDVGAKLRAYRRPDGSQLIQVGDTPTTTRGRLTDEIGLLQGEATALSTQADEAMAAARAPLLQRRAELSQRAAATETIPVADDVLRRYNAERALEKSGARGKAKSNAKAGDAPEPTVRPTEDAIAAQKELAALDAELAAANPGNPHAARLAEINDSIATFKTALRGSGPDMARGDWVPLAGAAGAVMHGNVLGGIVGAAAGSASRAVGRRLPAIWATITNRLAQGDPARVMRGVLQKSNNVAAAAAAAWTLDEEEYYAIRDQVRKLATGQAQRDMVIGEVAPNVANQMLLTQMRAAQYLESLAPTGPRQTTNPNAKAMLGERPPDAQAIHKWARRVQAVDDPYSVLRNPTMEGGQTLKTVYPKLFSEMRAMLIEEVDRTSTPVPLQRKVSLSLTFGVPLDPSIGGHVSMLNQLAYEKLRMQRSARPDRGQSMATERKVWSGSEEIETGGSPR